MHLGLKLRMSVVAAVTVLSMAGSALAASPALAYHFNYGTNGTGGAVPLNTPYTAGSSSVSLLNSSGNAIATCTGASTLGGKTTTASGSISNQLSVTSGSFNGCKVVATSQPLTIVANFSPAWQVTPTSGTGPIVIKVTVSLTVSCGSSSQTYGGTITGTYNNVPGGSNITFDDSGPLNETGMTGSGCGLSSPVYLSAVYTLRTLGGSPGSAANNLWLLQN